MNETIHPIVNSLNAPFWAGAADNELVLPYCSVTRRCFWPPSPISPFAQAATVEWRKVEAVGRLVSQVVYRRAFQSAFKPLMPYGIGLVELEAGPRIFGHIADPDSGSAPKAGERVSIDFIQILEGGAAIPSISALRRHIDGRDPARSNPDDIR